MHAPTYDPFWSEMIAPLIGVPLSEAKLTMKPHTDDSTKQVCGAWSVEMVESMMHARIEALLPNLAPNLEMSGVRLAAPAGKQLTN